MTSPTNEVTGIASIAGDGANRHAPILGVIQRRGSPRREAD